MLPRHSEETPLLMGPENESLREGSLSPFNSIRQGNTSIRSILQHFTRRQRDQTLIKQRVRPAAVLICDAMLGNVENPAQGAYDPYDHPEQELRNTISLVCRRICAYRPLVRFLLGAAWVLTLLTFLEPPHWCRNTAEGCKVLLEKEGIPADKSTTEPVSYYPNSHSIILTDREACLIEASCLSIIMLFTALGIGRDGMSVSRYFRAGPAQKIRLLQIVCLLLLAIGLSTNRKIHHPYTRILLLISYLSNSHKDLRVLTKMLPQVVNVLTLLAVFMLFYAWFGTVMFVATPEGKMMFPNLIEALWTLWICVTTANYPDVMMPAYNENRWVALYFVSFMVLTFFFLMNVILASVVNEFDQAMEQRKQKRQLAVNDNLRKAYSLLDINNTGRVDRETVMALFAILNEEFPEFPIISDEEARLLFAILDREGTSTITLKEFMDFGNVLLLEFVRSSDYATFIESRFPYFYQSEPWQKFCGIVKSDLFEYIIDVILVLNAVVIGIQSYPELTGQAVEVNVKYWDGSIDTVWEFCETIFTFIYALEVTFKIAVFGWKAYSESQKNIFDFTITILAVTSSLVVYYPNEFSDSRIIRMIIMMRVLRLIRLLTAMKRFQLIGRVSAEILPMASSVILILFYVLYIFAALGMHLYGGHITRDPANPMAYMLMGTDFSNNDYWANNFNDMISGMNVLFNLLVINNWTECEIGFEATSHSKWPRLFFLSFHLIGVILANNLVIAFVINAFMSQLAIFQEINTEEVVGNGEAVIHNRRAVFDASSVTGTKTELSGSYIARFRRATSDIVEGHHHDRLRNLFTQNSSEIDDSTKPAVKSN